MNYLPDYIFSQINQNSYYQQSHPQVSSNATMEENYSDSGFYIGDDQSINGTNINQLSNKK